MRWINARYKQEQSKFDRFAKWVSWAGVLLSILVLIYVYYRAEVTHKGALYETYFKYYLISLAGIFFWIAVLRLKAQIRNNIVMSSISLVVGLYLIEGVINTLSLANSDKVVVMAKKSGIEFDQRTKLQVLEDLKAKGIGAVPAVGPVDVLGLC